MIRRISLVVVAAGAALAVSSVALAQSQPLADPFDSMRPATLAVSPEVADQVEAMRQELALSRQLTDSFDRARPATLAVSPEVAERVAAARRELVLDRMRPATLAVSPEVAEMVAAARLALESTPIVSSDARDRVGTASGDDGGTRVNVPGVPSTSSDRDLDWPQLGIGFAVGILLALGLGLAMRLTRFSPLAR
jgi:hypothetical protein